MITLEKGKILLNQMIGKYRGLGSQTSGSSYSTIESSGDLWLGLFLSAPDTISDDETSFTEVTGTNYSRTRVSQWLSAGSSYLHVIDKFGEPQISTDKKSVQVSNIEEIHFNSVLDESGWGTITYFGIFTSTDAKIPIYWGPLTTALQTVKGTVPVVTIGSLVIEVK